MNIDIGTCRSFIALDGSIQILTSGSPRKEVARITFTSLSDCLELLQQVAWCADYINREGTK